MGITFEQINKTNPDDQNVLCNGHIVGTIYFSRHKPKPGDVTTIVRDLTGRTGVVPNESHAVNKLLQWACEDESGVLFEDYKRHMQSRLKEQMVCVSKPTKLSSAITVVKGLCGKVWKRRSVPSAPKNV